MSIRVFSCQWQKFTCWVCYYSVLHLVERAFLMSNYKRKSLFKEKRHHIKWQRRYFRLTCSSFCLFSRFHFVTRIGIMCLCMAIYTQMVLAWIFRSFIHILRIICSMGYWLHQFSRWLVKKDRKRFNIFKNLHAFCKWPDQVSHWVVSKEPSNGIFIADLNERLLG